MRKFHLALVAGLLLALILTPFSSFVSQCATVRAGVVRLHILANSDSAEDQALKLAVRDSLLLDDNSVFLKAHSKDDALAAAQAALPAIEALARAQIQAQGYSYPVKAHLVQMPFATKRYGDTILPAGSYSALRIEIGSGTGQNWWCVMYPPLCVPAAVQSTTTEETQINSLQTQPAYQMGFAGLELWQQLTQGLENLFAPEDTPQP